MPEWMKIMLALAGVATPVILGIMARDRVILGLISAAAAEAQAKVAVVKDETVKMIEMQTNPLHERISRVRDEYVRRDDLQGHLARIEKQFDSLQGEMRRGNESQGKQLDEIRKLLQSGARPMG